MKTIENNKLIAKFMGDDFHERSTTSISSMQVKYVPHLSELKYHSSWDWLIPVIKKIDSYANEEMMDKYRFIWNIPIHNDISEVYNQVVEFIEKEYENSLEEKADSDISIMKDEGLM
tara:strand:- start:1042 stop:1392 length:351 start_codon:yes stop_codon:yes gene_type:complete